MSAYVILESSLLYIYMIPLQEWLSRMAGEQRATPPHVEPVLLSYDLEEHAKHLDREMLYLLNKLRTHPPPKPKVPSNTTTNTSNRTAQVKECVNLLDSSITCSLHNAVHIMQIF